MKIAVYSGFVVCSTAMFDSALSPDEGGMLERLSASCMAYSRYT